MALGDLVPSKGPIAAPLAYLMMGVAKEHIITQQQNDINLFLISLQQDTTKKIQDIYGNGNIG